MNSVIACLFVWALSAFAAGASTAYAVCFYPNTTNSGYTVGLRDEIKATPLIIVGKVTGQRYIQGDPTDPEGITAYIYRIQVLELLKGTAPKTVYVRAENDSGGYRMNLGDEDLLFLKEAGDFFEADVCGNSSQLPEGQAELARVRAALRTATPRG